MVTDIWLTDFFRKQQKPFDLLSVNSFIKKFFNVAYINMYRSIYITKMCTPIAFRIENKNTHSWLIVVNNIIQSCFCLFHVRHYVNTLFTMYIICLESQ